MRDPVPEVAGEAIAGYLENEDTGKQDCDRKIADWDQKCRKTARIHV